MMEQERKRIVIVLGMHRSGTSVVTRGLMALGVDLGTRLIPPKPDDNEKGFWEDIDINQFNDELLAYLGHNWHALAPIPVLDLQRSDLDPFKLRAVELLREKLKDVPVFGLKDPRFARLLPFWKSVFEHLPVDDSYVIATRNPLSVARSLSKRDGIEAEKSCYLWLEHIVSGMLHTENKTRVVVDFDLLLADPETQLRRIAGALSLPFDPSSPGMREYVREFLKNDLRHTLFRTDDLVLEQAVASDVAAAFRLLDDLANDRHPVDPRKIRTSFRRFEKRLLELRPAFDYMTRQDDKVVKLSRSVAMREQAIKDRDGKISSLAQDAVQRDRVLKERDGQISVLNQGVAQRDQTLKARDGKISNLEQILSGREQAIKERDAKIVDIGRDLAARAAQATAYKQFLDQRNLEMASLGRKLAEQEKQIADQNGKIADQSKRNADQNRRILDQSKRIADLDQIVARRGQALTERDKRINGLSQTVARRDDRIKQIEQQLFDVRSHLDKVFASPAWRITAPLRFIRSRLIEPFLKFVREYLTFVFPGEGEQSRRIIPPVPQGVKVPTVFCGPGSESVPPVKPLAAFQERSISSRYVPISRDYTDAMRSRVKAIAFYLPQFHPIEENDNAWGKGFTEWTNVIRAKPQFSGHYQPRLPGELGFYDLRMKDVQRRQIELAKQYGVYGFCYHYYWFSGKKVLERPLEQMLADPSLDFPFCLCWANENWTRRWDGKDDEVILEQKYLPGDDLAFIKDIEPVLKDPRYIRIDGRPLLVVYRPGLLSDAAATAERWRAYAKSSGIGELFLAATDAFKFKDHQDIGFDGLVQFPPNSFDSASIVIKNAAKLINPNYAGNIYDYEGYATKSVNLLSEGTHTFPCVMAEWDNEARKPGAGRCYHKASPKGYKKWLEKCFEFVDRSNHSGEKIVFINAWNEWAEGTYLEPDRINGYAYLQATADVVRKYQSFESSTKSISKSAPKADDGPCSVKVSVIIHFSGQAEHLKGCLSSLAKSSGTDVPAEIIVVNDGAPEAIDGALEKIKGIVLVKHEERIGFLNSCNEAVRIAKGEYVWFLRSDVRLKAGALKSLVEVLDKDPSCGAVGSKLISPDGSLQEAGGIVWKDGALMEFGNSKDPRLPEYNYLRAADYCSSVGLMVRKSVFVNRNGFDKRLTLDCYGDADLCFYVRHELGMQVVYHPLSEVIFAGGSACEEDTSSSQGQTQVPSKAVFCEKWKKELGYYPDRCVSPYQASRRLLSPKTVLIIEGRLPLYDQDSGSRRLFELVKIFMGLGYNLMFYPEHVRMLDFPYLSFLQSLGVEVLRHAPKFRSDQSDLIMDRMPYVDYVWLGRYGLNRKYLPMIRQANPSVKHIFDTVDLHHIRIKRGSDLGLSTQDMGEGANDYHKIKELELRIARAADITVTVTDEEKELLCEEGVAPVIVVPNVHQPVAPTPVPFEGRRDIVFIGCYSHKPNLDAAEWLCRKIMPIIWERKPDVRVFLLGSDPTQKIKSLENERVIVPGYVPDVSGYFDGCRVFVAPLRYGAGMKGKIGQALEHSLPIVSTSIGVEGMGMENGKDVLVADDENEFAKAVLKLYEDKSLWKTLSANSSRVIEKYSPAEVKETVKGLFAILDSTGTSNRTDPARREAVPAAESGSVKIPSQRKIVLVSHDAHPKGAQYIALNIAKILSSHLGFKVDLVLLEGGALIPEFKRWAEVHDLNGADPRGPQAKILARQFVAEGHQAALVNTASSGLFLETLADAGLRCVALIHELRMAIEYLGLHSHLAVIAERAVWTVFPAQPVADLFQELTGREIAPEMVRPQGLYKKNAFRGLNAEARSLLRKELKVGQDTRIVLDVGYGDHRKGVDLFVEAGMQVVLKHPAAYFVWVGEMNRKMDARVKELLAGSGIEDHFLFPGFRNDTDIYYAGADVFALASREDPFPSVVMESLDVSVPVVAFSDSGGFDNLLRRGCGVLVRKESPGHFAEAILELLGDPGKTRELGERGASLVRQDPFLYRHYVYDLLDFAGLPLKRVSAVVPNYNYARFLEQRMLSIVTQTHPVYEMIVLDDASTDRSVEVIKGIFSKCEIDHELVENRENSGSVFRQWKKAVELSKGELLWIAEADDAADPKFLERLVPAFDDPAVVLAYCQSQSIDEDGQALNENNLAYTGHISNIWEHDYVRDGREEIKEAHCIKNPILNASAVLFRRSAVEKAIAMIGEDLYSYRVAGDWLIYLYVLLQGKVYFCAEPLSQTRRHSVSVTESTDKMRHLLEIYKLQGIARVLGDPSEERLARARDYIDRLHGHFQISREELPENFIQQTF